MKFKEFKIFVLADELIRGGKERLKAEGSKLILKNPVRPVRIEFSHKFVLQLFWAARSCGEKQGRDSPQTADREKESGCEERQFVSRWGYEE